MPALPSSRRRVPIKESADKPVDKPVDKRRRVDKSVDKNLPRALDAGDAIEYGLTAAVRKGRSEFWVKVGVVGHLRPGETPRQANDRLAGVVHQTLDVRVNEIIN